MPRLTTRDFKRPSRSSSASKLREFGLGVLVGAVLASAAFLAGGAHSRHRAAAASRAAARARSSSTAPRTPAPGDGPAAGTDAGGSSAAAASAQSAPARAGAQAPPQYDFYKMLPRLNVPVPHEADRPSHTPPPAATAPASGSGAGPSYLLQVGSYRSSAEADQVRARLARSGISARIERVTEGSKTWNRVRIGPLTDAELAKVREQLRTADIHALVIRVGR